MKKRLSALVAILLAVLMLPVAALAEESSAPEKQYMMDYFNGLPIDLTPYEGKALFINFFYRGCPYCMQEMPDLKTVYDTYAPEDVAIILVHAWNNENADDSAAVVAEYGLEGIPLVEDDQLLISQVFVPYGYPTSILIDKEGYLSAYLPGMQTLEQMTAAMDTMGVRTREAVAGTAQ